SASGPGPRRTTADERRLTRTPQRNSASFHRLRRGLASSVGGRPRSRPGSSGWRRFLHSWYRVPIWARGAEAPCVSFPDPIKGDRREQDKRTLAVGAASANPAVSLIVKMRNLGGFLSGGPKWFSGPT